jgi:hypothetical protein
MLINRINHITVICPRIINFDWNCTKSNQGGNINLIHNAAISINDVENLNVRKCNYGSPLENHSNTIIFSINSKFNGCESDSSINFNVTSNQSSIVKSFDFNGICCIFHLTNSRLTLNENCKPSKVYLSKGLINSINTYFFSTLYK